MPPQSVDLEIKATDAGASAVMDRFAERMSKPIVREVFIKESDRQAAVEKTRLAAERRAEQAAAKDREQAREAALAHQFLQDPSNKSAEYRTAQGDLAGYYRHAAEEADKLYTAEAHAAKQQAELTARRQAALSEELRRTKLLAEQEQKLNQLREEAGKRSEKYKAIADARHKASGLSDTERSEQAAEIVRMRREADAANRREQMNRRLYGGAITPAEREAIEKRLLDGARQRIAAWDAPASSGNGNGRKAPPGIPPELWRKMQEDRAEGRIARFESDRIFGVDTTKLAISVAGATMLGNELARATGQMKELSQTWNSLDTSGRIVKLGEALPIIGGFVTAGQNIREMILGEQEAIDRQTQLVALQNQMWNERRNVLRDTRQLLLDHEATMRRMAFDRGQIGAGQPVQTIEGGRFAINEEVAKAQAEADKAKMARDEMANSPALQAAAAKLSEIRQKLANEQGAGAAGMSLMAGTAAFSQESARKERIAALKAEEEQVKADQSKLRAAYVEKEAATGKAEERLAEVMKKAGVTKEEIQRQHEIRMADADAQMQADRLNRISRGTDAELALAQRALAKQQEQLNKDKAAGKDPRAIAEEEQAVKAAQERVAAAKDAAQREADNRSQALSKAQAEAQATIQVNALRLAGKKVDATIAEKRANYDATLKALDEQEKEDKRKAPEKATDIAVRYLSARNAAKSQLDRDIAEAKVDGERERAQWMNRGEALKAEDAQRALEQWNKGGSVGLPKAFGAEQAMKGIVGSGVEDANRLQQTVIDQLKAILEQAKKQGDKWERFLQVLNNPNRPLLIPVSAGGN